MADERITEGMKHQLGDLRRKLDRDERPLGYKLGFGTEAGDEEPRHRRAARRLPARRPTGSSRAPSVDISNWGNPKLEPEIVARAGEKGEITAIGVGDRARRPRHERRATRRRSSRPTSSSATSCSGRSPRAPTPPTRSSPCSSTARRWPTADDVTEATGDLDGLVKHVAKTLKAAGAELERGDMVICGSIVPALDIAPGATVEVRLPPLGSLVVNFE